VLFVLAGRVVAGRWPGGDGVLARLESSSGAEFLVHQRWQNYAEPYSVSFYSRTDNGSWGWCYLGHQELRWRQTRLEYDARNDVVQVFNGDVLRGRLDCATQSFAIFDDEGRYRRSVPAPQELRDPPAH
jgi:hypothetical protein